MLFITLLLSTLIYAAPKVEPKQVEQQPKVKQEIPKQNVKEVVQETPKQIEKEIEQEVPKQDVKEIVQEIPKQIAQEIPKQNVKEIVQETPSQIDKTVDQETSKDMKQTTDKDDDSDSAIGVRVYKVLPKFNGSLQIFTGGYIEEETELKTETIYNRFIVKASGEVIREFNDVNWLCGEIETEERGLFEEFCRIDSWTKKKYALQLSFKMRSKIRRWVRSINRTKRVVEKIENLECIELVVREPDNLERRIGMFTSGRRGSQILGEAGRCFFDSGNVAPMNARSRSAARELYKYIGDIDPLTHLNETVVEE